jgi:protein-S-isoprenylcysteine O-methyltransferase Ste14
MSAPPTPGRSRPVTTPVQNLPPFPLQLALRVAAAAAHAIFVARMMQTPVGIDFNFSSFVACKIWWNGCVGSLQFFAHAMANVAPWTIVECLTLVLLFGVPFQLLMRLGAAAGLSVFVMTALANYEPGRLTLLLMVITETLTVALVLVARPPGRQDWRPVTAIFTTLATFYFLFLDFGPPEYRLFPEWAGVALQGTGVAWTIFAKLSLGRSFGLLPADRGIVTRGAYRWVRHPVYFGYFLNNLGYLLPNFGWQNLLVYGLFFSFQLIRVLREEKLLAGNPDYRAYCTRVRWRLVPLVF